MVRLQLVQYIQDVSLGELKPYTHTHACTHSQPVQEETFSHSHTFPAHQPSFINFLHLSRSIASSLLHLRAWQSFYINSVQVLSGLSGLELSASYSVHFFTQSLSSFRNTCPYHRNLFCCNTEIMSTIPSLSTPYLKLYLLPKHHTSIWPFSFLPNEVPPHFLSLQARSHFHVTYYTTAVQQWYQLLEFISSTQLESLPP